MKRSLVGGLLVLGAFVFSSPARAVTYGPTPYLSAADSPFPPVGVYYHLENFEDGALNTPGVTVNGGATVVGPGSNTDSVDGDDGAIDGSGLAGSSLYSNQTLTNFTFDFNAAALGGLLPNEVGIVWTDVGFTTSGDNFSGPVTVEAFNSASTSVGVIGPVVLGGDGTVAGATAEDRFFGFSGVGPIARLVISMSNSVDWEVDHLQYAFLPEPTGAALAGGALAALAAARRRRA